MNDLELIAELHKLGLDADSFRAVTLLPLVEVAWADQSVQPQERKAILLIAKGHDLLRGRAADVVEDWLTHRPSDDTFALGRRVLATLAHRKTGLGADVPEHVIETVVDLCAVVAESVGGLFGVFFTTSADERRTIRKIADHLDQVSNEAAGPNRGIVGRTIGASWVGVLDDLDEE